LTASLAAGMSDERFFQTIRRGVPGTEMPAFDAEHNADVQV
jgi:predicted ATP-dependent Lon-type protease